MYKKELVILLIQLLVYYVLPLFAGPADMMGLVVLIIFLTFILSLLMGIISKKKIKFLFPLIVSIVFIPSVLIYYNDSAYIYIIWYLIDSIIGILTGTIIKFYLGGKNV